MRDTRMGLIETEFSLHEALLQTLPEMAWIKDRSSRYIAVSAVYLEALGERRENVVGRLTTDVWPADLAEVYLRTDRAVMKNGRKRRYEEARRDASGVVRWYDTIKSPIRDQGGHIIGTLGISRDITERRESEQELIASRAQLRTLSAFEQKAREEERARIARELHDELGQTLTAMKMELVWLKEKLAGQPQPVSSRIDRLVGIADQAVVDLRRIATELRPMILDELGLRFALEWLVQTASERSGLPIALTIDRTDFTYHPDLGTAVFRIVQEALTNIFRHGEARTARIDLRHAEGALRVTIADDGRGIDPQRCADNHLGLAGMRERARLLGGQLTIETAAQNGTTIHVRLPLEQSGRATGGVS